MTVAVQNTDVVGTGTGSATEFSFSPLVIFVTSDLVVTKTDILGVNTVLSEGSSSTTYSVAPATTFPGVGSVTYPAVGGTPLAVGEKITMKRVLTIEQLTDLTNQGPYNPDTLETELDKHIMIALQQEEELNRSIKVPISVSSFNGELPTPVALEFLRANAAGTALEFSSVTNSPASNDTPEDVSLSAGDKGVSSDFSRKDHVHLLPTVSVAKGGTGATTASAARTALAVPGTATENTFTARQNWAKGGDIASASPLVIDTDGNYFDVTGTTGFSAMTVPAGTLFMLQFDGALVMTHGASLKLPGAANITTVANDRALCFATAANVVDVISYTRADGTAVVGGVADGQVVQIVNFQSSTKNSGSTILPHDDTIPQSGEGDEYMSLAITPASTTNNIKIDVVIKLAAGTAGFVSSALFQDTTANALAASDAYLETAGGSIVLAYSYFMVAGTTSATTFKVRAGPGTASTVTFNGTNNVRNFGGTVQSSITITEIQAS